MTRFVNASMAAKSMLTSRSIMSRVIPGIMQMREFSVPVLTM